MLQFFRNMVKRPLGIAVLGLIIFAFIVTLYQGNSLGAGGASTIARVSGSEVTDADVTRRAQLQLDALQAQSPGLDMTRFVAEGGIERIVDLLVDSKAIVRFAADHGLVASDKLVDGLIASVPAFAGPNGRFDQTTFEAVLQQRRLTQAQLREDFAVEATQRMLLTPASASAQLPQALIDRYARLLLEVREGEIAVVPSASFVTSAPVAPADVTTFYSRNIARYTVPERRVVKYAVFNRDVLGAAAKATEAEIAAAYRRNTARYTGRELRAFTQIIVQREADAQAALARIRGGATMAAAAAALGLEPLAVPAGDRAAFERLTSKAVADAAFAAPEGGLATLTRSGLGFHVVRVDDVTTTETRPLAAVRDELVAEIEKTKGEAGMADLVARIEDAIAEGATFDEAAKQFGLAAAATPPVTVGGANPDDSSFRILPAVGTVLRDAFQAEPGDDAQVAAVAAEPGTFVLYDLDRVIAAAAPPLAAIRAQVEGDARIDRAVRQSRALADRIAAAVDKGTPLAQAMAQSGVRLPAPARARGTRLDATNGERAMPPSLRAMFSMTAGRSRVLRMEGTAGWFVIRLDRIVPGDPAQARQLALPVGRQLNGAAGDEYVAQFLRAVRNEVGAERNAERIAALKRSLSGAAPR